MDGSDCGMEEKLVDGSLLHSMLLGDVSTVGAGMAKVDIFGASWIGSFNNDWDEFLGRDISIPGEEDICLFLGEVELALKEESAFSRLADIL